LALAYTPIFITAVALAGVRADDGKSGSTAVGPSVGPQPASLTSRVTDQAGKPVSKATIVVAVGRCQVYLPEGEVIGLQFRAKVVTDEAGRFAFPAVDGSMLLAAMHATGHAEIRCSRQSVPESIKLFPWARAEGTYQIAGKPQPNVSLELSHMGIGQENPPWMIWMESAKTDANGRFVFERALPGPTSIRRNLNFTLNEGYTEVGSGARIRVVLIGGKTNHVEFRVSGRPVIGQLRHAADLKESAPWSYANVDVEPLVRLFNKPSFEATADREGNFSIEGVPPGEYVLNVFVRSKNPLEIASERLADRRFIVPEINEKLSQRPVDLGILTLKSTGGRWGKAAHANK
jgi:protocatechuate 3,4-dioxygenase beta subunit